MRHKITWTPQKISQRLGLVEGQVYRQRWPLPPFRYTALPEPETAPPVGTDVDDSAWETIAANSYWGEWKTDFVMRTTFAVPADWPPDTAVALYLPIGEPGDFSHPEALVYVDGRALAACDRHHQEILLPDQWQDGKERLLALHGWTGLQGWFDGGPQTRLFMRQGAVVQIDQPTRDFVAAARVALGVADQLHANHPAKDALYNALNDAFRLLDIRRPGSAAFYTSMPAAHTALMAGIAQAGAPLDVRIVAAGHAHLDIAWLWTTAQARRKASRTFHNVLHLMEQFPAYHFTQSQPQLYDYIRQDEPALFAAIKQRVAEGRWEALGGMWVEADCTLTGAESLARQFLLGRAFFREQFGPDVESPVLWLPDVFGYAANLPQLIREAGLDYFFTIKISWNQYNRLPYDSFWWQGLDGTKVLTHFSTTQDAWSYSEKTQPRPTTYNGTATPQEIMATWENLQQKDSQRLLLTAFGYGDGGGGPTREMLENIREMAGFPGTPQVGHGRVIDFFRQLEAESGAALPTWHGELYLELHRGTYTTQADIKRRNRQCEFLLHDAEFLAAFAAVIRHQLSLISEEPGNGRSPITDYRYPHAKLTRAWRLLALNQFHDILPGSAIAEVYADSHRDYDAIWAIGEQVRDEALALLAQQLPPQTAWVAVNPTAFGGSRLALLPDTVADGEAIVNMRSGEALPMQLVAHGTLVELDEIAAHSLLPLGDAAGSPPSPTGMLRVNLNEETAVLENTFLRATFNQDGDLISLFDKEVSREILAPGTKANIFQAFEDRPLAWEAWDIDIFYEEKEWRADPASQITISESGPLRAGLEIRRTILHSEIVQRIYLGRNGRQLTFDTWINWQENQTLLKVAFPVDILSPHATYDVQWGNVQRPTHRNTSWDWARFETYAHKWVDLSEGDYGVSLLNDGKYGHDVRDNVMRLTLLRSPSYPDPNADRGEHRFTYSLLPHRGDWRTETVAAAYVLNNPILVQRVETANGGDLPAPLLTVDAPNVIVETIKQAEDGNGLIVRLYENQRCRGPVILQTSFPLATVYKCNLLETNQVLLQTRGETVNLTITPYQVVTLRLVPG